MLETLVIARFAHLLALSIVLGAAFFPFYGLPKRDQDVYARVPWLRPLLIGAAVVSGISGTIWYTLHPAFEEIALFRLVLVTALIALTLGKRTGGRRLELIVVVAAVLLASIALTGNPGSNVGRLAFQH